MISLPLINVWIEKKFQLKVLSVIDKELSEIEKTTESKNSLLSLESSEMI